MDLRSAILCGWAIKKTFVKKHNKEPEASAGEAQTNIEAPNQETEADFLARAEKAGKKAAFVCQSIIDNAVRRALRAAASPTPRCSTIMRWKPPMN